MLKDEIKKKDLGWQQRLKDEKEEIFSRMATVDQAMNRIAIHLQCLSCDTIKQEALMLLCGHNICKTCLAVYSATDHPRSAIRCEECTIETKINHLVISMPNRAFCSSYLEIKSIFEEYLKKKDYESTSSSFKIENQKEQKVNFNLNIKTTGKVDIFSTNETAKQE